MIRWFLQLLYGSTPAEFRSAYGLTESVERLRDATKRSAFSALGETAAVGKVTADRVRLQRVIPMVGNSFKPFFIGRFEERAGAVVLTGKFTMLGFVKVFMSFWLGMTALFAGAALLGSFHAVGPNAWLFRVQPFLMMAFGVGLIAAGKWFARNDAAWLSDVIERALAAAQPERSSTVMRGVVGIVDPAAVPGTLKGVAAFLALTGVMTVAAGVAGNAGRSAETGAGLGGGPWALPAWGPWMFIYAACLGVLSVGVWRRRPWAWWAFFGLLGLSAVWPVFALSFLQTPGLAGPPGWMGGVFAIFSCAVVAIWGRWWYAQRRHFLWG